MGVRVLGDRLAGPVGGAFEKGNQFPVGIDGPDLIEPRLVAEVDLFCFHDQEVTIAGGACEGDGNVEGHADDAVGIAGKGEGAVGGGEKHTAMDLVKTI